MAKSGTNDFSSPQEAIEGYLEALLQDVADYDDDFDQPISKPVKVDKKTDYASIDHGQSIPAASGSNFGLAPNLKAAVSDERTSRVEFAYQEAPAVVMPELRVAEPEVEIQVETTLETQVVVEPEVEIQQAEPEYEAAEVEDVTESTQVVEDVVIDSDIAVELAPEENEGWTDGRPDWAQGRFECLLFVVKGLKLAVPLAELGGIHKLEKEPTPLFGQPGWFLGIMRANARNVGLVDTAQWVMPERIREDHEADFRFAIRIHNSDWGLACNEVAEAISLHPDEVKWRTSLGRRPWLAGTVVDHMCALIDVAAFARLLDSDKVPVNLQELAAASND